VFQVNWRKKKKRNSRSVTEVLIRTLTTKRGKVLKARTGPERKKEEKGKAAGPCFRGNDVYRKKCDRSLKE